MTKQSKNVTKRSLVNFLEYQGFSIADAEKAVNSLLDCMRTNLIQGNTIQLNRIGVICPLIKKGKAEELFGKKVQTKDRIKLKIKTSRTLHSRYKNRQLSEKSAEIRGIL